MATTGFGKGGDLYHLKTKLNVEFINGLIYLYQLNFILYGYQG